MKKLCSYFKSPQRLSLIVLLLVWLGSPVMADHHTPSDYPALGVAEYPGLCKYRGHIGKYECIKVKAKKHSLYSCKGKGLYYSKKGDVKACYSCPNGYTRFSPTRKMTHAKACTKRQSGKNAYAKATKVGNIVKKCGKGQFKHNGSCKSCPAKTNRMNVAMLDNGYCKVEKEYRCNKGLKLYKSEPKTGWNKAGNLIVPKYKKYCGIPFSLKQYGKDILASDKNQDVLEAIGELGKAISKKNNTTKKKMKNFKKAVKDNQLLKAYDILASFEEFEKLKNVLSETENTATSVGGAALNFTITMGYVVDASVGLGGNYEWGTAIDFSERKVKKYKSYGLSKGFSLGIDGGLALGVWKGAFNTSSSQGYVGAFEVGYIGGGVGVWSDYYTPKRSDGSNQPHFVGFSISVGAGAGVEVGEYNEVYTKVTKETNMLD